MKEKKKMKKYGMVIAFIIISSLTACGNQSLDNNITEQSGGTVKQADTAVTVPAEEMTAAQKESDKNESTSTDDSFIKSRNDTFIKVLEEVYQNHVFPNGNDYGISDYSQISENKFAIYDIDFDGKDELIIQYTTTAMAGMIEAVFEYDSSLNTVKEEFMEFPALTYYDNGIVEAEWSHNQGLGGEFWPYTLYQYSRETDAYIEVCMVDAWDKSYVETDFPDELDKDGDGIVYYIMEDGTYELKTPVDLEEYMEWRNYYLGQAEKLNIPYRNLTEENIYGIGLYD